MSDLLQDCTDIRKMGEHMATEYAQVRARTLKLDQVRTGQFIARAVQLWLTGLHQHEQALRLAAEEMGHA